jgi:hypothetical protein
LFFVATGKRWFPRDVGGVKILPPIHGPIWSMRLGRVAPVCEIIFKNVT